MKAIVVYESHWGNTAAVARATRDRALRDQVGVAQHNQPCRPLTVGERDAQFRSDAGWFAAGDRERDRPGRRCDGGHLSSSRYST